MDTEVLIYIERSHKRFFNVSLLYGNNDLNFDGIKYASQEVALDASCLFEKLSSASYLNFLSKSSFFDLNKQEYVDFHSIVSNSSFVLNGAWNLSEDEFYILVDYIVEEAKKQDIATNVYIEYNGEFKCIYKYGKINQTPIYMHLISMKIIKIS